MENSFLNPLPIPQQVSPKPHAWRILPTVKITNMFARYFDAGGFCGGDFGGRRCSREAANSLKLHTPGMTDGTFALGRTILCAILSSGDATRLGNHSPALYSALITCMKRDTQFQGLLGELSFLQWGGMRTPAHRATPAMLKQPAGIVETSARPFVSIGSAFDWTSAVFARTFSRTDPTRCKAWPGTVDPEKEVRSGPL